MKLNELEYRKIYKTNSRAYFKILMKQNFRESKDEKSLWITRRNFKYKTVLAIL